MNKGIGFEKTKSTQFDNSKKLLKQTTKSWHGKDLNLDEIYNRV